MDIQAAEARLRAAMLAAEALGHTVSDGKWGVSLDSSGDRPVWAAEPPDDCLCPMGCLILGQPPEPGAHFFQEQEATAARLLECSEDEIKNFVVGFDGAECDVGVFQEDDFYALGRRLRLELDLDVNT
jgi:hypothetical protein